MYDWGLTQAVVSLRTSEILMITYTGNPEQEISSVESHTPRSGGEITLDQRETMLKHTWCIDILTSLALWDVSIDLLGGNLKRGRPGSASKCRISGEENSITSPWIWKGVSATSQSSRYTLSYPRWRLHYKMREKCSNTADALIYSIH